MCRAQNSAAVCPGSKNHLAIGSSFPSIDTLAQRCSEDNEVALPHEASRRSRPDRIATTQELQSHARLRHRSQNPRRNDGEDPRVCIPIQKVNEAYERMIRNDVRYRFVIDLASLE